MHRIEFLPFHVPAIGEEEIQAVAETLRSGWLTTGVKVKRFEESFSEFIGTRHAIALNSGTAVLHLALEAVGVKEGDEVIVPTMTFAATGEVVRYLGAIPVLVDCDRETMNIDPAGIEKAITDKTRAIMPVHFGGQACQMDRILMIARENNLRVIEDAAHALPSSYRGRKVGTIGDITCFSFYATKTVTTGEGGMATTENAEWADRMRVMGLHGISRDAWKRYTAEGSWYYEILAPGYKYNMPDVLASIGIEQLKKCERLHEARSRWAALYTEAFSRGDEIVPPHKDADCEHSWHLYVILLRLEHLSIDRNRFIQELKVRNIGTSVHFIPLHLHPYYQKALGYRAGDFPNAEWVYNRCISLPLYPTMTEGDVHSVTEAVADVVKKFRR